MCFEYASSSVSPVVATPVKQAEPVKQAQPRRINPAELAKQVAALAISSGKVTRTDSLDGVALTEYKLNRGDTRVLVQTASGNGRNQSGTFVQVKRGRKLLLTGNGIGIGGNAEYADAQFTPGSWTKPFRLVEV